MTEFEAAVLAAVRAVPVGGVATYGEMAEEAGRPGAARAVGNVLKHADDPTLPWWRIIRADGTVPKGAEQARRLAAEGVPVTNPRSATPRVPPHPARR